MNGIFLAQSRYSSRAPQAFACLLLLLCGVLLGCVGCKNKQNKPKADAAVRRAPVAPRTRVKAPSPSAPCPEKADNPICKTWKLCYEKQDVKACFRLGVSYERGEFVKPQPERAKALFFHACKKKSGKACMHYALMLERVKGQEKKALGLFKRACSALKWGAACTHLGIMHEMGAAGVKRDEHKAFKYFKKACLHNEATACSKVGLLLQGGHPRIERNLAKAQVFLAVACKLNDAHACGQLGKFLLEEDSAGKSRFKDALPHIKKSCKAGDFLGCTLMGIYELKGLSGVPRKARKAAARFKDACARQEAIGCYQLGLVQRKGGPVRRNMKRALASFKKACSLTYARACKLLVGMYERGRGVPKSVKEANTYRDLSCVAGDAPSCYLMGKSAKKNKDMPNARRYLHQACMAKHKAACALFKTLPKAKDSRVLPGPKTPKEPPLPPGTRLAPPPRR